MDPKIMAAAIEVATEQAAQLIVEEKKRAREGIKRQLREYTAIKAERAQIEQQLRHLDGAPSGTRLDGMPRGSGTGDPVARIGNLRAALKEKYQDKLASLLQAQLHVEDMIESLGPVERKLLRHRYIEGLEWEDVCVAMSYSWRQTHNIHARALNRLVEKENTTKGLTDICD